MGYVEIKTVWNNRISVTILFLQQHILKLLRKQITLGNTWSYFFVLILKNI